MAQSRADFCIKEKDLLTITYIKEKVMVEQMRKKNLENFKEGLVSLVKEHNLGHGLSFRNKYSCERTYFLDLWILWGMTSGKLYIYITPMFYKL